MRPLFYLLFISLLSLNQSFASPFSKFKLEDVPCNCPTGWTSKVFVSGAGEILASDEFPTTSSLTNYCIYVTGTFVIDKDMNFNSCNLFMNAGSHLKVRSNSKLGIYGSNFSSCTKLWYGIELEDNSWVSSIASFINDALYGITKSGTGYSTLLIKNTSFFNNIIGIYNPQNLFGGLIIGPDFIGNKFIGNRELLESPQTSGSGWTINGDYSYAGMIIYDIDFKIGKSNPSTSEINYFENLQAGICSYNNFVDIKGTLFSNIPGDTRSNGVDYSSIGLNKGTGIFNAISTPTSFSYLTQEGFGKNGNASFGTVDFAIWEYGGACNIQNNKMLNVGNGILQQNAKSYC